MSLADRIDSTRQYRLRLSQWKLDKNIKPKEMRAIVRKRQYRKIVEAHKPQRSFHVRGREVEARKIDRWMSAHGVDENKLYAPSPAASAWETSHFVSILLTTYSNTFCRGLQDHL